MRGNTRAKEISGTTGKGGRGNGPLAAPCLGESKSHCALAFGPLPPAFSACFHISGDNASASHLLLTSMHFPADFPICLSSLVVKDLMGSSACSASALVTGSILSARDEAPERGSPGNASLHVSITINALVWGRDLSIARVRPQTAAVESWGRMGAPCQRSQGGLCLQPCKCAGVFLHIWLSVA